MRRVRYDRELERQAADLDALEDAAGARVVAALEDERRALREVVAVAADGRGTPRSMVTLLMARVTDSARRLRERLAGAFGGSAEQARVAGVEDAQRAIGAAASGIVVPVPAAALSEDRALGLSALTAERFSGDLLDRLQRTLVWAATTDASWSTTMVQLTAAEGPNPFAALRGRANLAARMEMNRTYNAAMRAALHDANRMLGPSGRDPFLKRADEVRDGRNHPISRVLHGQVQPVRSPFVAPMSEVDAAARSLRRRARATSWEGAVLWPLVDGAYVGDYPAHYGERGRAVPWRASWGK